MRLIPKVPWYLFPQIELVRFAPVDFFPPKPKLSELRTICIGTKTRTIGDALMLSSLPRKLKKQYPGLRVLTYPRGFNPVVFWNNPDVDGITWRPGALYGDDCNEGTGQLIELKDAFFGLPRERPKPELYLTQQETEWGSDLANSIGTPERRALPLLLVQPYGQTIASVFNAEIWARFVRENRERFRIAQVGVEGQTPVADCDLHFLAPRKRAHARRLFALMKQADRFIGIDSGPMHVARAFDIPSLILASNLDPSEAFQKRRSGPYYVHENRVGAFLYEDARYLHLPPLHQDELIGSMSEFLKQPLEQIARSR